MPISFLKGLIAKAASGTAVDAQATNGTAVSATTSSGGGTGVVVTTTGTSIGINATTSDDFATTLQLNATAAAFAINSQTGINRFSGLAKADGGIQLPVGNSPTGTSSGYVQVATDHGLVFNDAGTLRIGRTIEHGTSFPGSPYTNQLFYHDSQHLLYEYDGTRWLSTTPYTATFKLDVAYPVSASGSLDAQLADHDLGGGGVYLLKLKRTFQTTIIQSGSVNYSFLMFTITGANAVAGIATPASTAACITASRWYELLDTYNAASSAGAALSCSMTKNGAAGNLTNFNMTMTYKLIGV